VSRILRLVGSALLPVALVFSAGPRAIADGAGAAQTTVAQPPATGAGDADPFLWLEDVHGAKAMEWVQNENAKTLGVLEKQPEYAGLYADALAINQSKDRIPYPSSIGTSIYNFWQDETHVRGIWRRTTPASYASEQPQWSTVLDLDALATSEHANWVWEGADCVYPREDRCLIELSDGGEDARTVREFDLATGTFVKDGFVLPRGKQNVAWENENTLLVSREWAPGELTASGYPYVVKRLRRGQALTAATEIFRGQKSDISVQGFTAFDGDGHHATFVIRGVTFFTNETWIDTPHGLKKTALPEKSSLQGLMAGRVIVKLDQDWAVDGTTFTQGSLVSMPLSAVIADPEHLHPSLVYAPGPRESVESVSTTKHTLLVVTYENVRGRLWAYTPSGAGWTKRRFDLPDNSSIFLSDSSLRNDRAYVGVTGFLAPTTLYTADASTTALQQIKQLPPRFDASKDVVEQHEATSKDGTKIPYFIIHPRNMVYDGTNPTVLYAYGGFQVSLTPSYSGILGKLWLERGGVYVLANIRGGGEFGPAWHEAGLKTHRQRIYDDFYAVAQDLVASKVTTPRHLGIMGGSNGGLLMGVEFTQHPEAWNAVDIQVPLLDMLRFEKIEAGASWVGEYGSVSIPQERAFLASISPYNNLHAGTAYPEPLIWTTTKDDRVGPEHARKFAAKLGSMQVPYLFYEVTEGGHGSGANLKESAHTSALEWSYFSMKLMGGS